VNSGAGVTAIKEILKKKKARQVGSLYTSTVLGMIAGLGVSIVNTRLLGPEQYGDLKFLQTLFTFVVGFVTIGLFVSGGRLLAQRHHEERKQELIGNLLILAAGISLFFIVILFAASFLEERLFENELGGLIRLFSPLFFVFPFQLCLANILEGDNRIYRLSLFRISPQILYLVVAISFNYFFRLKLVSALAIQLCSFAAVIIAMIIVCKPEFRNIGENLSLIWKENKTYGFPVYIGALAGVASAQLGGLSVGYFVDNTNVGFYSLAITVSMPLRMIPNVVGTTFFKDFANRDWIPRRVTGVTLLLSLTSLLVFFLAIGRLIVLLYSPDFRSVVPLAYLVGVGFVFHGFGDYVGKFLGAHGKGREKRNGAFVVGLSNVFGYTVLVYLFGVKGAALTRMVSGMTYCGTMCYFYKKLL